MSQFDPTLAATELLNRRDNDVQAGCLADMMRPNDLEQAFAIQQAMVTLSGQAVGGWKCLLPISPEQLIAAPILANTVQQQTATCVLKADKGLARIEPEITFILGHDLPAKADGYSDDEIEAAIASCHMALELMKSRFSESANESFYEKLSDCLLNQGLYIGPELDRAKAYQASEINITVSQHGKTRTFAGVHPNASSYKAVYWLINYMSKRGVDFTQGQAIITGSYAGIVDVDFDAPVDIEYEGLGSYQITFKQP